MLSSAALMPWPKDHQRSVQKDFERWYTMMARQQSGQQHAAVSEQSIHAAGVQVAEPQPACHLDAPAASVSSSHARAHSLQQAHSQGGGSVTGTSSAGRLEPPSAQHNSGDCRTGTAMPALKRSADDLRTDKKAHVNAQGAVSAVAASAADVDWAQVPDSVRTAAAPFLTGDPRADRDIVGFYVARQKVLDAGQ